MNVSQLPLFTRKVETFFVGSVLVLQETYVRWDGHIISVFFYYF